MSKTKGKKILSLVLALVMVVAMLPTVALAYDTGTPAGHFASQLDSTGSNLTVEGNTVKLNGNITVNQTVQIYTWGGQNDITLDLGTYTLTLGNDGSDGNAEILTSSSNPCNLTITGKDGGKITTNGKYAAIDLNDSQSKGVTLTVTGPITIENTYATAIENGEVTGVAIKMGTDASPKTVVIDGATISGVRALDVTNGSTVTIKSGTLKGTGDDYCPIRVTGESIVNIEGGTIEGKPTGVSVWDGGTVNVTGGSISGTETSAGGVDYSGNGIQVYSTNGKKSTVNISGSAEVTGKYAVSAYGEGADVNISGGTIGGTESGVVVYSGAAAEITDKADVKGRYGAVAFGGGELTVSGGTVTGEAAGIGTNGSDLSPDTTVNVTGGKVTGEIAGVYLPSGNMNVKGEAEISGKAGIVVRGGDLDVQGGTIEATGKAEEKVTIGDAKQDGQTYEVPAAGITVDNAGYQAQAGGQKHVTIGDGATVKAAKDGATLAACNKGAAVAQEGGKVKPEDNPFSVSGGTFTTGDGTNKEEDAVNQFLAENYEYGDNGIEYKGEDAEVTMDGVSYKTLDEALKSASKGSEIKLLKNVEIKSFQTIDKDITIDLGEFDITRAKGSQGATVFEVEEGGKLTVRGTGTITADASLKDKENPTINVKSGGEFVLEGGSIVGINSKAPAVQLEKGSEGKPAKATINGGSVEAPNYGVNVFAYGDLTVAGGKVTGTEGYGVATNGSASGDDEGKNATVTVTGGEITGGYAGMYLPSQNGKTTITGEAKITGTDGAGIVVRGGTIEVKADKNGKAPAITAKGTKAQTYGDNNAELPAAALVVDKNTAYGNAASAAISGGTFAAAEKQPSVVYTEDGVKPTTETKPGVEISGGTYTSGNANDLENIQNYLEPGLTTDNNGKVEADDDTVVGVPDANGKKVNVTSTLKDGVVEVVVDGNVSASHSTASPSNTWWAGVGFVAPQNAKSVKYAIDGKTATLNNPILDSWKDGETTYTGFTFWADASKFPKKGYTIVLEWFSDNEGTTSVGKTTYHVTLAKKVVIEPFKTEIVDFGYAAEKEAAKTAAAEGRKNANGASYDSEWTQNLDWADQTMWITFKDPIPAGITVIVPVTTPSGALEDIECVGNGTAYTFAWSYKNSEQTGATSVEVGDYTIDTSKNPVTATQDGKAVEVEVAVAEGKDTATVPAGDIKVSIVDAGFKADAADAKTAIEATYEAVTGTTPDDNGNNWAGGDGDPNNGIEDAAPNTMWVTFKHDSAQEAPGVDYTVNVIKDDEKVYEEKVEGVKKGAVVYISLDDQLLNTVETKPGEYVFQIVKDDVAVASRAVTVYEVKFYANGGTFTGETPATVFAMADDADSIAKPTVSAPEGKIFSSWKQSVDEENYTITYTAEWTEKSAPTPPSSTGGGGGSGSSATVNSVKATNGSFAISDKNAKAGDTVKITPKANDGYVVDQVTVTDKNGNNITVTQNADGTYSFVMPEKSAQPVDVKVTFKLDDGEKDCPSEKFTDVDQDKWYHEGVDYAIKNGLMNGTGADTFAPDATTTRAMVVTILYRLDGEPAVTKDIPFADVPAGQWYSNAINWAAANGIVDGYGNGKFGPDDTITREQMAAILYRYASYKGYSVSDLANLTGYTDAASVSEWASTAMRWAVAEGLIEGTNATTLSPSGDSTRAQVATILMRFCEGVVK